MNTAELIVALRTTAHALETPGYQISIPELVNLLDTAANELKVKWVQDIVTAQIKDLLIKEPSEEQKKAMLRSFDHDAKLK